MDIPEKCTVLVIGGGPAGSYAASVLAREGIDTVLLEADLFPRYHVGESMLPSMRHFLRFIDLEEEFNSFGFVKKKGAVFKLNSKPEAYTDFLAAGGPNCHSWNVTRSDADNLLFTHASKSGARTFDGVKVTFIQFDAPTSSSSDLGKPVSASWTRKDGSTGCIAFEFLVDASGRAGLVSTKYMKNRRFNEGLKNIATWGYWEGAGVYGAGTRMEGDPVFEAIEDGTGWIWSIPLQDETTSIGVVMNQAAYLSKKQDQSATTASLYHTHIQNAPTTSSLLSTAKLTTPLRTTSDWSYTASSYSSPYIRIAGDAGCFIDPFFSSGVHLALASGLSAAVTICASIRGQCTESVAAQWHSEKVSTGYTRFLMVVMCSLKQIESREEPVLSDWDEGTFDRAFGHFRPVIQGTIPTPQTQASSLTQAELANTVSFCLKAFQFSSNQDRSSLLQKLRDHKMSDSEATPTPTAEGNSGPKSPTDVDLTWLTPSEKNALDAIRARQMVRLEDMLQIRNFSADEISGLRAVLRRGEVGLVRCDENESDGEGDDGGDGVVERKRGKKMNNMLGALGLRDQMGRMEALF